MLTWFFLMFKHVLSNYSTFILNCEPNSNQVCSLKFTEIFQFHVYKLPSNHISQEKRLKILGSIENLKNLLVYRLT